MHGTLDNPPIIIEQDKGKTFLFVVVLVLLSYVLGAVILKAEQVEPQPVGFGGYVFATFFVGMTLWFVVRLVCPGRLIVDRDGLTIRLPLHSSRYSWEDIAGFVTSKPGRFSRAPAFILAESSKRHQISRRFTGDRRPLGSFWEFSASELVDILNDARKRWGRVSHG
jgi:hypothetical protein